MILDKLFNKSIDENVEKEISEIKYHLNKACYDALSEKNIDSDYGKKLKKEIDEYEKVNNINNSEKVSDKEKEENVKSDKQENQNTETVNVINVEYENPLTDISGITDKWSKDNIKKFNDYMISVRQTIDDIKNEGVVSGLVKKDFRNLKLLGIRFSKNKESKNDMTCILMNINTHSVFEVFRIKDITEIIDFKNQFEYKSKYYERLAKASQLSKEEKTEYLNRYCRVDFKLFPKEEKTA